MGSTSISNLPYKESVPERIERTFDTLEDIITTLRSQGCPHCLQLLRDVIVRNQILKNHFLGGSSLETTRGKVCNPRWHDDKGYFIGRSK